MTSLLPVHVVELLLRDPARPVDVGLPEGLQQVGLLGVVRRGHVESKLDSLERQQSTGRMYVWTDGV